MKDEGHRSDSGHALLEASIAIGLMLWLSMGILDLARVHEARTATKAAVATALRCVHPSDAACRGTAQGPREIAYDVYQPVTQPIFFSESYEYAGVARVALAPVYTYPDLRALVISRAIYDLPGSASVAVERLFPASAEVSYLARRESLPSIRGALSTDPRFVSPTNGSRATPLLTIPIRTIAGTTRRDRSLGRVTFRLAAPAPGRSLSCHPINREGRADLTRRCEDSWEWEDGERFGGRRYAASPPGSEGTVHTFVALRISGEKRGGSPGARGSITARLVTPEREIDLGGRRLDSRQGDSESGAIASFVPRGLPFSQVLTADRERYSELWDYQALRVPFGQEISIELALHAENGEVGWRGEEIEIFAPEYDLVTERLPCAAPLRPSDISSGRCVVPSGYPRPESVRQESAVPIATRTWSLGCGVDSPFALAISLGLEHSDITIETMPSSDCPPRTESYDCPENFGVPEGETGDRVCPVPPELESMVTNVRWESVEKRLREAFEWRPAACGERVPPRHELPPELLRYPRLLLGRAKRVRLDPVNESEACPSYERRSETIPRIRSDAADSACDWRAAISGHPALSGYDGWTLDLTRALIGEKRSIRRPPACARFREAFEEAGRRLLAAGVPASRALSICNEKHECLYEPVFSSGGSVGSADTSAAASLGLRELGTIYPRARQDCSGPDCAVLEVGIDGESAFASARLEVPLLVLAGKTVTLEHASRRRLEDAP